VTRLGGVLLLKMPLRFIARTRTESECILSEEMKESDAATTRVKEIYAVYRVWSDERGERPMTQIAFHRKLSDRGLQIIGQGSRAEIKNYIMAPRSVESNEINWELATRLAR